MLWIRGMVSLLSADFEPADHGRELYSSSDDRKHLGSDRRFSHVAETSALWLLSIKLAVLQYFSEREKIFQQAENVPEIKKVCDWSPSWILSLVYGGGAISGRLLPL